MTRSIASAARSSGSTPAHRKYEKEEFERGKKAGYAWAESGRSIAAVEAVVKFATRPTQCAVAEVADLLDKMVEEIGDDEEFEALQDKDDAYIGGWYVGVVAAHETM